MPAPCRVNDLLDRCIVRFPAEFVDGFLGTGDEAGGVAVATPFLDGGDRFAADLFAGLDHFAHGVALAVAEIVKTAFARLEREDVRLGEIDDVNVVADAGAVRRGVVGTENPTLLLLAKRNAQHVGDEVRLDPAMFTKLLAATGGVEVAECHELESVQLVVPFEDRLEHQLAFAVRVDRFLRFLLGDRHGVRHAVGGGGGAKNKFFHASLDSGVEQIDAIGDVVAEILRRIGHRLADLCERSEVHDGLRSVGGDSVEDSFAVTETALDKSRPLIDGHAMSLRQVVKHRDLMAGAQQFLNTNRADVTGASRNKYLHIAATTYPPTGVGPRKTKCRG